MVDKAIAILEGIRTSYAARDFEALTPYCSPEMKKKIKSESKGFTFAELEITPKWIDIDQVRQSRTKKVIVKSQWKGNWKIGEKAYERQGNATFILEGEPLVLSAVEGNNPFTHPQ